MCQGFLAKVGEERMQKDTKITDSSAMTQVAQAQQPIQECFNLMCLGNDYYIPTVSFASSESQPGVISPPNRYLAMSWNIFHYHSWEEELQMNSSDLRPGILLNIL